MPLFDYLRTAAKDHQDHGTIVRIGLCNCDQPVSTYATTAKLPDFDMICENQVRHRWFHLNLAQPVARLDSSGQSGRRRTTKKSLGSMLLAWHNGDHNRGEEQVDPPIARPLTPPRPGQVTPVAADPQVPNDPPGEQPEPRPNPGVLIPFRAGLGLENRATRAALHLIHILTTVAVRSDIMASASAAAIAWWYYGNEQATIIILTNGIARCLPDWWSIRGVDRRVQRVFFDLLLAEASRRFFPGTRIGQQLVIDMDEMWLEADIARLVAYADQINPANPAGNILIRGGSTNKSRPGQGGCQ